jgi:hypothetical protein
MILREAKRLLSDPPGSNSEYDRAIVELVYSVGAGTDTVTGTARLLGVPTSLWRVNLPGILSLLS